MKGMIFLQCPNLHISPLPQIWDCSPSPGKLEKWDLSQCSHWHITEASFGQGTATPHTIPLSASSSLTFNSIHFWDKEMYISRNNSVTPGRTRLGKIFFLVSLFFNIYVLRKEFPSKIKILPPVNRIKFV